MLKETIQQALDKGLIKSGTIIVDSTHTTASVRAKSPTQILRDMSKQLRKEIYKNAFDLSEKFPEKPCLLYTSQQRKKFGSNAGRVTGSFIAFLFPLGRFHFRETVFRGKVVGIILPDTGKEIIKSSDAGSIPERESAEDGIKRSFPEHAAPDSDGSYFQL